jgi:phage shock protein PspC (stress-responsive transcriptional regulator)
MNYPLIGCLSVFAVGAIAYLIIWLIIGSMS